MPGLDSVPREWEREARFTPLFRLRAARHPSVPPNVLQRLGVKVFGGEKVIADKIIVRQRGTKLHACNNVGTGRDWTLFALKDGTVAYDKAHRCVSIVCPLFWHSKSAGFDAGAPFAPHPAFTCASTGPV